MAIYKTGVSLHHHPGCNTSLTKAAACCASPCRLCCGRVRASAPHRRHDCHCSHWLPLSCPPALCAARSAVGRQTWLLALLLLLILVFCVLAAAKLMPTAYYSGRSSGVQAPRPTCPACPACPTQLPCPAQPAAVGSNGSVSQGSAASNSSVVLYVGVLSGAGNRAARDAIRQSWGAYTGIYRLRFVLGRPVEDSKFDAVGLPLCCHSAAVLAVAVNLAGWFGQLFLQGRLSVRGTAPACYREGKGDYGGLL